MQTLTLRTAVVVAALPLALASLSACGSGSGSQTATEPQAGSTITSPEASGASASPAVKHLGGAAFLGLMRAASQKITTARFALTTQVSGQNVPIRGVIDMTGASPAARMTMDLSGMGTPSQMVMIDRAVYVQVPGSNGMYYKIDLADPNGPLASLGHSLDNFDPGALTSSMTPRMFGSVTDHGVVTLRGQQVHHYTARMNLRAVRRLPDLPATASLPRHATYDVWLDGRGRLARFRMQMGRAGSISGSYSDYGRAARIVAPPAARVVALPGSSSIS